MDLIDQHCSPTSVVYALQTSTNDDQMSNISSSMKNSANKILEKFLQKRSPDAKFVPLDSEQDAQRLLRKFTELKLNSNTKQSLRPFLFAESFSYENSQVTVFIDNFKANSFDPVLIFRIQLEH